jgi:RHS repeat-associated protein
MTSSRITLFVSLFSFFISTTTSVFSQPVNNYAKDVSMPAPNAASLGKYGDYSVGNFTGVPDISIPIYNVQEGPLSLPIGLSYHASGIKVAEMASWVGTNWALSAGGIITRTIQGLKDEHANGYFNNATLLETRVNQAGSNATLNGQLNEDISNGQIDGEPDIFSFNVGGYTGKFYIDKNHKAQFIPKQDLKLDIEGALEGFTIITPEGTRFVFGKDGTTTAQEITQIGSSSENIYISSWYLLKVETPDKLYKINLSYADENYSYLSPASIKWNVSIVTGQIKDGYSYTSNVGDAYHKTHTTYMSGKKLVKITGTTDSINFIGTNTREDLDGISKSLDKIEIFTGTKCQKFDLVYGYFQDPTNVTAFATPSVAKKLRLESVRQSSCDGNIVIPPHIFTYEGSFLPHRLSKAIDHWGFYNGATTNETKIANIPLTSITPDAGGFSPISHGSSNRETNEAEMKKGVLNQIKFPTGGTTIFNFEANTIPTSIQLPPQNLRTIYSCPSAIDASCCGVLPLVTTAFTPSADDVTTGKYKFQLTRPVSTTGGGALCPSTYNPTAHANFYQGSTFLGSIALTLGANSGDTTITESIKSIYTGWQEGTTYTVELVGTSVYASFTLFNQPLVSGNKWVGGLRVKEIRTFEGVSDTNDIVKQYDYSLPTNLNSSSAMLFRTPKYGYDAGTFALNNSTGCALGGGSLYIFNDESIVPLYTFEGNHIGYVHVKETQNGNGTKVYKFNANLPTINGLYFSNNLTYPTPPFDPVVTNGSIYNVQIVTEAGSTLKSTSNIVNAEITTLSVGKIRKVIKHYFEGSNDPGGCQGPYWAQFATDYRIRTLPYRLASTTETVDNVPSTVSYTYSPDAAQPLFPLTISMTNSDGKISVVTNKYVTHVDYFTDLVADKMKLLNIIAMPLEETTSVNGVQVNGKKTQYGFFEISNGLPTTSTMNTFPYPYQFFKYKMTWGANGEVQVLNTLLGWELEATITKYSPTKAKPETINLRAWENATETNATEKYTWETNGLIKTRQFKGFTWKYEYLPNTKLISKVTNKDGQFVTFMFDDLLRKKQVLMRNGAVKVDYAYSYTDPSQSNKNWIETKTTFSSVIGGTLSNNATFKTVRQYLDGLSRPVQHVAVANSPTFKDVISVVEYDKQGREFKIYDPYESTNSTGFFIAAIPVNQLFSKMEYEASPLSRIWKTTPQNNWLPTITEYGTNGSNEVLDVTGSVNFAPNTLHKVKRTDPDGRVLTTFRDKKGRNIFTTNTQNNVSGGHFMMYAFDDKDHLSKVVTPRGAMEESILPNQLDFAYIYDWNDNLVQKKLTDITAINMIYNARNQMVMMQDGNLTVANKWLATQYDPYGRPIATGFSTNTDLNSTFNPTLSSNLTVTTYSNSAGITLGKPIRTQNYQCAYLESFLQYDEYGRLSSTSSNSQLYAPIGLMSPTNFSEKIALTYDLADNVLTKTRTHKPNSTTTKTIVETMDYDNGLRLKQIKHKIDALPEQILSNIDYDIKNQVQTKRMGKVGALNYLQKVDYTYNALGWLTGVNIPISGTTTALVNCTFPEPNTSNTTDLDVNDLFSMELKYDTPNQSFAPNGTTVTPQYSGNISQVSWQVRGREKQAYTLKYDALNRMTEAVYSDISVSGTVIGNRFDEKLTYDSRGNINTLQRWGLTSSCTWGMIDNLIYNYGSSGYNISNKLNSVTDQSDLTKGFKTIANGGTYSYDSNGNMTADPNKGITSIVYNHLNLPTIINFIGGNKIEFAYDAGGNKLRKTVSGTTNYIQNYVGGIEYRGTTLEAIYHSEGRVTTINGALKYEYCLKDHLGNTRIMFCDKDGDGKITQLTNQETSEVTQENHHYSFGLSMEGVWSNTPSVSDNKYQFGDKELNDDFGLGWIDFGARNYDPAIVRWTTTDPLADAFLSWSPYNYVLNSPLNNIDPTGMAAMSGQTQRPGMATDIWGNATYRGDAGTLGDLSGGKYSLNKFTGDEPNNVANGNTNSSNILPVFYVKKSRYKAIYLHHVLAFTLLGHSPIMTYSSSKRLAELRSKAALSGIPTKYPLFHRDEIPYKSTFEGGANASVAYVTAKENTDHGSDYGSFLATNNIQDGQQFMVVPENDTQEVDDPVPVPNPTFIPYPKFSLFDKFDKWLQRGLQGNAQPAFNTLIVIPFLQGLEWEKPRSLPQNGGQF